MLPVMHARARVLLILVTMTALVWTRSFGGDSLSKQAQPKGSQSVRSTQSNNQQSRNAPQPQHQSSPSPTGQKSGAVPLNVNHNASSTHTAFGGSIPKTKPDQPTPGHSQSTQPKNSYGVATGSGYVPVQEYPATTNAYGLYQMKYGYDAPPSTGYVPVQEYPATTNAYGLYQMKYGYDAPPSTGYVPVQEYPATTNAYGLYQMKYSYDAPPSTGYVPVQEYPAATNTYGLYQMKYSYDAPPSTGYVPVQNNGYVTQYTPPQSQTTPKPTASSSLNTASAADAANSLTPFTQASSAITFDGGAQTPFLGGDVAVTYNNSGVKTITTTSGEGPLRFSAYHTSDQNNGLCWSPDFGVPGMADIGLNACAGTDGASFGASGGVGLLTGSVSVPSQLIFNAYMDSIYGVGNWLGTGLYNAAPNFFNGSH
jgi:hypothetical protein